MPTNTEPVDQTAWVFNAEALTVIARSVKTVLDEREAALRAEYSSKLENPWLFNQAAFSKIVKSVRTLLIEREAVLRNEFNSKLEKLSQQLSANQKHSESLERKIGDLQRK